MAVPANFSINLVVQDNRGYKSLVRLEGFDPDISADTNTVATVQAWVAGVGGAIQSMSNAKVVRTGFSYDFNIAQQPSGESGVYELAIQKAKLDGGDGMGGFQHISIPAPKDAMFLTSADNNLIVVDPASSLVTGLQAAIATSAGSYRTPRGGVPFSQFFGGQLTEGKPRRRRVLQGA